MKFIRSWAALIALALSTCGSFGAQPAYSQVAAPTYQSGSAILKAQGVFPVDSGGTDSTDPTNHALRVNVVTGQVATTCAVGSCSATIVGPSGNQATVNGSGQLSIAGSITTALPAGTNLLGGFNVNLGGSPNSAANPLWVVDGYNPPVATTWSSATSAGTAATSNTAGYDTVIVTLVGSAGLTGASVAFELYDGAAWIPVKAPTIIDYTTTSLVITPPASSSKGYQVPVAGFPQFRVRLISAPTAGTLTVTLITSGVPDTSLLTVGLDPAQPLPAGTNVIGQVTPAYSAYTAYSSGTIVDMRAFATVQLMCTAAPTAGSMSVGADSAMVNSVPQTAVLNSSTGITTTSNIVSAGVFSISGGGYFSATLTGGTCFVRGGNS